MPNLSRESPCCACSTAEIRMHLEVMLAILPTLLVQGEARVVPHMPSFQPG